MDCHNCNVSTNFLGNANLLSTLYDEDLYELIIIEPFRGYVDMATEF